MLKIEQEDWVINIIAISTIILIAIGLPIYPVQYSWNDTHELFDKVLSKQNILHITLQLVFVEALLLFASLFIKTNRKFIVLIIPALFLLTIVAQIIAGSNSLRAINIDSVLISLFIGMLIGNSINFPSWITNNIKGEYFVKIGLVLLGTTVIFEDILKAGIFGLVQAVIVVISVWYFSFWLCKKLGIDKEMSMMLSSAVSICGVSAAIATAGAIKGDQKKLSYVVSLVLITAIPMMIGMPYIASWLGLSQEVTGAWLGGSIDTTGAVVASGSLVGEKALQVSTIVKFSQNVLLGLAAILISIAWSYYNQGPSLTTNNKPSMSVIWERFPKFIIGFLAASVLFSFVLSKELVADIKSPIKNLQHLWFTLSFTCIGLESKVKDIFNGKNQKPLKAFLIAQLFNILITLLISSILFKNVTL